MERSIILVAVALLLAPIARPGGVSSVAGLEATQAGGAQSVPPGWAETKSKTLDLTLAGKDLEVVAIYEQWVAKHPDFSEAHAMLGAAHESVARTMLTSHAPDVSVARTRHFEAAVLHLRRALELADPRDRQYTFMIMRTLIDLHGLVGLNRPAEYERLVLEGVKQFPAEPFAHAYLLEVLAKKGEPIDAAARAARAAIPKGPGALVNLADILVRVVEDEARLTPALATALLPEASRLVNEALKLKPDDAAALKTRARIERMRNP